MLKRTALLLKVNVPNPLESPSSLPTQTPDFKHVPKDTVSETHQEIRSRYVAKPYLQGLALFPND